MMDLFDKMAIDKFYNAVAGLYSNYMEIRRSLQLIEPDGFNEESVAEIQDRLAKEGKDAVIQNPIFFYAAMQGSVDQLKECIDYMPDTMEHFEAAMGGYDAAHDAEC